MRVSVIIPSKGCQYLEYALRSLRSQTVKPHEVILVLKDCDTRRVEGLAGGLNAVIIEQKEGFFTHALNTGKREARGDIVLFTDDDVIFPESWVERYVRLHMLYRNIAGISSRDIYLDLSCLRLKPTPDDMPWVRIFRWLIRPAASRPHSLLRRYRLGVYITERFEVAHGPCIPYRTCYSLPLRGANMSFKAEYVHDAWFPEHPKLVRAPGNEQYFALQSILRGFDTIYVPDNPVLHIAHESLSRVRSKQEVEAEIEVMRGLFAELLGGGKTWSG